MPSPDFLIAIDYQHPVWILFAFLFGLAARKVGLPPLVGFLIAGFGLNWLGAVGGGFLNQLADLGVTLLLFTIGLKLNVRSLLRPEIWGVTTAHLLITIAITTGLLLTLGGLGLSLVAELDLASAALVAFALSFSSTVFAIKVLEDQGELNSRYGQLAVGALIVQDIFAVAFLAISSGKIPSPWALGLLLLIPLRPLLQRFLDHVGHGELLILFGVVMALGGAGLFEFVGMKGDLGALVFGVLLGGHPKAKELATALFSFKELFLVGFFLSVGMGNLPGWTEFGLAVLLLALIPLKAALFFALYTRFKVRARSSTMATLSLSNYSEFGLIVGAVAISAGWLDGAWLAVLAISLSLSFVIAAPLNDMAENFYYHSRHYLRRFETRQRLPGDEDIELHGIKVAVFGMGRVGKGAYDAMRDRFGDDLVGVDVDDRKVAELQETGRHIILGDPLDHEFWRRVDTLKSGLELVLLAMPRQRENLAAAQILRERKYQGRIAAIARHPDQVEELKANGVDSAFNLYAEAGAGFSSHVCEELGQGQS